MLERGAVCDHWELLYATILYIYNLYEYTTLFHLWSKVAFNVIVLECKKAPKLVSVALKAAIYSL